jgi:hypothetical protein
VQEIAPRPIDLMPLFGRTGLRLEPGQVMQELGPTVMLMAEAAPSESEAARSVVKARILLVVLEES